MKRLFVLFIVALSFFSALPALAEGTFCEINGGPVAGRWCVDSQSACGAICDFYPDATNCQQLLSGCDDEEILQFSSVDADGVGRGCRGVTPQGAGCAADPDACRHFRTSQCDRLVWLIESADGEFVACEDIYTNAKNFVQGTDQTIEMVTQSQCQQVAAQARGGQESEGPPIPSPVSITNPLDTKSPEGFIGNVISALLALSGTLALVMFVWGGVQWLTSGGNRDKIQKGKQTLIWAVAGLVFIFSAYAVVNVVLEALSVTAGS